MTLSKFLTDNNIKLSKAEKSRLGHKLSNYFTEEKKYVKENNYLVIDYPLYFLNSNDTQLFIIESLNNI